MSSEPAGAPACAKCGAELRTDAAFCARCGTRISDVAQEPRPLLVEAEPSTDRSGELRVVGWLYGLLLLTSLVFGITQSADPDADVGTWYTLVAGAVIVVFAVRYRGEIRELFRPALGLHALKMLAIAASIQFVLLGTVFYLLVKTGVPFERITDEIQRHHYSVWQLLALYSLAPAVFEEIAFRGVIFGRLRAVLGDREGWLVQAALFSVLHLSPVIFPTHFAMGLIFGWLRMRTGSLIPGMILHATWNATIIVLELRGVAI
jgi:membrane protease YdiL (CAAX protease family)